MKCKHEWRMISESDLEECFYCVHCLALAITRQDIMGRMLKIEECINSEESEQ